MQAPRGKQFKLTGNVVNVPADVINTVNMLPRLPLETGTIKVQLKRWLQYKSSALSLNVRPHKVCQAATWLANTNALYREQGITLDQNWERNFDLTVNYIDNFQPENGSTSSYCTENNPTIKPVDSKNDDWSEGEAEIPAGVTDTMLTATDFLNDNERQHIMLHLQKEIYSELLPYAGIFLGQKRPEAPEDKTRLVRA